jgi:hypothetical protein
MTRCRFKIMMPGTATPRHFRQQGRGLPCHARAAAIVFRRRPLAPSESRVTQPGLADCQ